MTSRLASMIALGFALALLPGCQKDHAASDTATTKSAVKKVSVDLPPAVPLSAPTFLSKTITDTKIIEAVNDALPLWRKYAKHRPLLTIIASFPPLLPIPDEQTSAVEELLQNSDDATLSRQTSISTADPVILPTMSVSAALDVNWFSGVVWIFPTSSAAEKLDLEVFRQQIVASGIASSDDAATLFLANGVFTGTLRGKTFIAAPATNLPNITDPMLLHIDCAYYKPLYKGEIKTPLFPLVIETLNALQKQNWQVAAITISRSNADAGLPLSTRFLADQIFEVVAEPEMLSQPVPQDWNTRSKALYLENFFEKEKTRELYKQLEQENPADPSVKYALYILARQFNRGEDALKYLAEAVRLDPYYAMEYVTLSDLALQKQRPDQAVNMLKLARSARPEDPFLLMLLARTILNTGERSAAAETSAALHSLHWSDLYYPGQNEAKESLAKLLEGG